MKRTFRLILICIFAVGTLLVLNLNVTTQQCIDYDCYSIRLPLYLKILDFFDRHYNYAHLIDAIIKGVKTDREKVMKILEWTNANIRKNPEGFPVIDDHVWHIIIRGYGVREQFHDVFTTLCNYAGLNAFFSCIYSRDRTGKIPLSFVKVEKKWCVFDPCAGVYFKGEREDFADIETIKSVKWSLGGLSENPQPDLDYALYIDNLPSVREMTLMRANIQSPLNRLLFEMKKRLKYNKIY